MKNIRKSVLSDTSKTSSTGNKVDAEELWKFAWTYIRTVVDTLREPFLILDGNFRIISANKTFYKIFQVTQGRTEGKRVYDLGNGQWNIPQLKTLLEDILPKNTFFEDFKVEHDFPKIGHRVMMLNARRIYTADEKRPIILLAIEDVTKQKQMEDQLRDYANKLNLEVSQRTAELEIRVRELERINKIMVGREMKMIQLKSELAKLKKSR